MWSSPAGVESLDRLEPSKRQQAEADAHNQQMRRRRRERKEGGLQNARLDPCPPLGDGRTALARFSSAGRGGTLEIRSGTGSVLTSGALPTTVAAPPLFAN